MDGPGTAIYVWAIDLNAGRLGGLLDDGNGHFITLFFEQYRIALGGNRTIYSLWEWTGQMNIAVAVVAFVVGCTQEFCDKYSRPFSRFV